MLRYFENQFFIFNNNENHFHLNCKKKFISSLIIFFIKEKLGPSAEKAFEYLHY